MINLPYSNQLTPNLIWNIEQNKPSLVARDMAQYGIPVDTTRQGSIQMVDSQETTNQA